MKLFLIDYENVNSAGLEGISQLSAGDRVVLFYSQSANTISFDVFDELFRSEVMPEKVNLSQSGKNALDFQLVTYLGYLIAREEADEYFIISRDTGYAAAVQFCKQQFGVRVQMKPSIKSATIGKSSVSVKKMAAFMPQVAVVQQPMLQQNAVLSAEDLLARMDPPVPQNIAEEILACMNSCRTESEFHNALQNQFRSADTKRYYHSLKRCFKAIKAEQ